ncbi:MAG: hypothetical protein NTY09_02085 [bacterium]|nr:hypothetical protein [bacterium]
MIQKLMLFAVMTAAITLFTAIPAFAQTYDQGYGQSQSQSQQIWALGGGYFSLPNVDSKNGKIDTSGIYASASMRSTNYLLEFEYSLQDAGFYALAADYLYPLSQEENYFGGSAFIGAGYTYLAADEMNNANGFNLLVGAVFSDKFLGTIRYDLLGNDEDLMTFGVSYSFM